MLYIIRRIISFLKRLNMKVKTKAASVKTCGFCFAYSIEYGLVKFIAISNFCCDELLAFELRPVRSDDTFW